MTPEKDSQSENSCNLRSAKVLLMPEALKQQLSLGKTLVDYFLAITSLMASYPSQPSLFINKEPGLLCVWI